MDRSSVNHRGGEIFRVSLPDSTLERTPEKNQSEGTVSQLDDLGGGLTEWKEERPPSPPGGHYNQDTQTDRVRPVTKIQIYLK